MKEIDSSLAENIMDENIQIFLGEIRRACQINNKRIHTEKSDFPIFEPANHDFFEYKYYEKVLETYIREYLITPILYGLFVANSVEVLLPKDKQEEGVIRPDIPYSNAQFGSRFPFAFIANIGGKFVGFRYFGFCLTNDEVMQLINQYNLSRVEIIDWDTNDSLESKKTEYSVNPENRDKVYYVTLKRLFANYYSETHYKTFLAKIRTAVERANKEIGFQTIPNLSLRYLSDFKEVSLREITALPLDSMRFRIFDYKTGEPTERYFDCLSNEDRHIIQTNFATDGLMRAMIGNEPFARCFITSEYLYKVFEKGNEKSFDYSAIATGYFKSVELLLMKIVNLAFGFIGSEDLWIKVNHGIGYKEIDNMKYRENPNNKKIKQVRFKKEFEQEFSTEMGSLIWFLFDWPDGWNISEKGCLLVRKCLLNYNQGCRNEHLHKDIISNIDPAIKSIRENTILCLYYLLGGCKLTENPDDRASAFEIYSGEYNRLYKRLQGKDGIPGSVNRFYIQFPGKEPVRAIRLYQQDNPENDDQGNQKSGIRFITVIDFANLDYEELLSTMTTDNTLIISQDNMPERMWFHHSTKGRVEIEW